MGSLTSSSWRSSSLTFVSPQNQQHPTVRPLTSQSRFTSPSRSKMAKIGFIVVVVLLVMVVVGFVVGDTVSSSPGLGRQRARPKPKRRFSTSTAATVEELDTQSHPTTEFEGLASIDSRVEEQEVTEATTVKPKTRKTSRSHHTTSARVADSGAPGSEGCGLCDMSACKNPPESSCAVGLVLDRCSCCYVCGVGEGNRCYNASIPNLSYSMDVGMCGTGLSCLLRSDLDPSEPRESLCECREKKLVCGNDNQTYISECKIREAAHSNPGLAVGSWGPCVSAPWMPTAIENATVVEGDDVSLSCEVKAFPSAVIHWEFVSSTYNSGTKILPGDDSSVVVVVRGGPEQTMSTSWIQIIAVTNERQGMYYCVARNSEGVTRSPATVTIYNHGQAMPPQTSHN
ncbi:Insulin-like growth factor-binding protein-related protein 1 [Orchesella cincta]|uniref:Insulin-like growth factor-binding protein-related protein 1 n=1 Tax=Orchesella cincta TaxID=48709 RepID=A0A1D2N013_ORCCI|nr:Insulin-like growth factor-binding protein-related protein 1 [Orchesella cincta]